MMADTLEIFGVEYANVNGFQAQDENGNWITYVRPSGTPENITVTIKNAENSGGAIGINNAMNVNIYGIAPQNPNAKSLATGASLARTFLVQDGCIVLNVNSAKLVSATYNGESLPITANSWYARIELPSNFDNSVPIVVKR